MLKDQKVCAQVYRAPYEAPDKSTSQPLYNLGHPHAKMHTYPSNNPTNDLRLYPNLSIIKKLKSGFVIGFK